MQRLTIVKVWYQNDFGTIGLRDERLTRALLRDSRVARVVHLEPPLAREPLAAARTDDAPWLAHARRRSQGIREGALWQLTPTFERGDANPWHSVLEQVARFLEEAGAFGPDSLLWVSAPGALGDRLLSTLGDRFGRIVSEVEDDHREYHAASSSPRVALARCYERIVRAGDLLISNNARMLAEWSRLQPDARLVRNAVDARAYTACPPEPAAVARLRRPRITYAGNLRLRLERRLFAALARAFPDATIVLAGIGGDALVAELGSPSNVHWLGCLPSSEVPPLLMHSDVLVMPHTVDALTDSMDPQKIWEYLASGRPIVATPVAGACEHGDLIRLAESEGDFVAAVRAALAESDPAAEQRRRARGVARSWDDAAREVVDAALGGREPLARWRREQALGYFQHERPEVRALIPAGARRVVDVGCGAGALGATLKLERDAKEVGVEVVGIELDATAAARAREVLDDVRIGDAITCLAELPSQSFDVVLFADLLEHLREPEQAVAEARRLLRAGGVVIASLPNVRHWSVVRQLLEGDFRYEPAGILDRTHLRFFTQRSARRLFAAGGFTIERCVGARWSEEGMPAAVQQALCAVGLDVASLQEESREQQWLFVARPAGDVENSHGTIDSMKLVNAASALNTVNSVSVVIPVCSAADYTRACLTELQLRGEGILETIVVDNGSSDATAAVLAEFPAVTVIRNAENRGFAVAVNQGITAARGELVCVLNNDTLLADGWLAPLVRRLTDEPSIGMVGPCTSYAKGRQQVDLIATGRALTNLDEMRVLAARWCERERDRSEDVAFLSGFCFVARRSELLALGGLADAYGRGTFEDDELCRRMRRNGRRLVIARDAYVHHFGNRTFRALGIDVQAQQSENWQRFAARHRDDAGMVARQHAEQRRFGDTLRSAHAALVQSPSDLDALWLATFASAELGRPADAARLARRYLARCPADPLAHALLARCESASAEVAATRNVLPSALVAGS